MVNPLSSYLIKLILVCLELSLLIFSYFFVIEYGLDAVPEPVSPMFTFERSTSTIGRTA